MIVEFEEATECWQMLQPGQIVYEREETRRGPNFYRHEIVSIDANNRVAVCIDHSRNGSLTTLTIFHTIKELRAQGITMRGTENFTEAQIGQI
jgi:hypothetical protein